MRFIGVGLSTRTERGIGTLTAAQLPGMRAERVLALPHGRPVSRATRETVAVLKQVCGSLIDEGKILTAPPSRRM